MKKYRKFIQWIGLYIILLGSLWLFLIATAMIPNRYIKENMKKSAAVIGEANAFAYCDGNKMNGIADNYADSIWLNVAWFMGKGNPFVSSIDTRYYAGENQGQNIGLYLAVTEEVTEADTDYSRYWHGTAGIIRMLHLFMDLNGIRYIGFMIVLCLAAIIMILLIKNGKDWIAVSFFLSICAIKIWNIRLSMEYQPAFMIGFLMCILYLLFEKKGNDILLLLAIIGGTLIAFFDFLTTETVTILLPLILVISVRTLDKRIKGWKENLIFVIMQGIVWLMSYGITIVMKWSLASVVTGENKFTLAFNMAKERVNGTIPVSGNTDFFSRIWIAPAANLTVFFGGTKRIEYLPLFIGIACLVFFLSISMVCIWKAKEEKKAAMGVLLLLGILILFRYMVLNNHSYLHAFFTYRGLISLNMAMFAVIVIHFNEWKTKRLVHLEKERNL